MKKLGRLEVAIDGSSMTMVGRIDDSSPLGDLANQLGAVLPVSALAAQLESGLIAQGHGDDDMSALARAIRTLSALEA